MDIEQFLNRVEENTNSGCGIKLQAPASQYTVDVDSLPSKYIQWLSNQGFVTSIVYDYESDGVCFNVHIQCIADGIEINRIS